MDTMSRLTLDTDELPRVLNSDISLLSTDRAAALRTANTLAAEAVADILFGRYPKGGVA